MHAAKKTNIVTSGPYKKFMADRNRDIASFRSSPKSWPAPITRKATPHSERNMETLKDTDHDPGRRAVADPSLHKHGIGGRGSPLLRVRYLLPEPQQPVQQRHGDRMQWRREDVVIVHQKLAIV
ncbi:uncharacterized protein PV07_08694 [Cladophialophora immunda]|uniref:Uncharacterized protein n=1 Tax=Cladophialophora immunda TaxID=569365 RepID=A0A0D2C2W6_9EURO|nr:uncharacterized protein PV07_08694 [Cladophialophora immunda]KIW25528.1 hypothetical protein PV07_08694 [Cladophialophora immunda]